jgi:hypothetical protein
LLTAKIIIAEGGEISVICRPIDRVTHRRHGDERCQSYTDAMNFSQEKILQGDQHRTGDHHYPQAPPGGETDEDRANDKPAQQDQRERHKYARYQNSRFQQIDRKERSAAGQRNTMNSIMQIEQVDTAVAKERHRECPWRVMEEIDVNAIRLAQVVVTRLAESERQLRSVDHPHRRNIPSPETGLIYRLPRGRSIWRTA